MPADDKTPAKNMMPTHRAQSISASFLIEKVEDPVGTFIEIWDALGNVR